MKNLNRGIRRFLVILLAIGLLSGALYAQEGEREKRMGDRLQQQAEIMSQMVRVMGEIAEIVGETMAHTKDIPGKEQVMVKHMLRLNEIKKDIETLTKKLEAQPK